MGEKEGSKCGKPTTHDGRTKTTCDRSSRTLPLDLAPQDRTHTFKDRGKLEDGGGRQRPPAPPHDSRVGIQFSCGLLFGDAGATTTHQPPPPPPTLYYSHHPTTLPSHSLSFISVPRHKALPSSTTRTKVQVVIVQVLTEIMFGWEGECENEEEGGAGG